MIKKRLPVVDVAKRGDSLVARLCFLLVGPKRLKYIMGIGMVEVVYPRGIAVS